jgi:hypothetical protein
VETGWSESFPQPRKDKDVWLKGTMDVQMVILVNWNKLTRDRVKGMIEVWGRDNAGNPVLVQEEVNIYPILNFD